MRRLVVRKKDGHPRLHQEAAQHTLVLGATLPGNEAGAQFGKDRKGKENDFRMLDELDRLGVTATRAV